MDTNDELATEQQLEQIYLDLCNQLHLHLNMLSVDDSLQQLINAAVFTVWCERMADVGDREVFEELLTDCLADEWEEHTIH